MTLFAEIEEAALTPIFLFVSLTRGRSLSLSACLPVCVCRCTISELKSLIIKYAFPLKYFAELNDEVFLEICKKLLTRSDVVFEESARNTIESACSMTAEVEVLKVRCSKACIDRTLVGGQVSLLFQLSDNEMQLLKALGKKRFDGLLQAEMPKEVKEVNKSMIPHSVNTLLELGLAVKHRVSTASE